MLSLHNCFHFLILISIRSVQSCSLCHFQAFLLQFSLKLFACGIILIPYQILLPGWLILPGYFRSCYLYQITLTWADFMHFALTSPDEVTIFLWESYPAFPLTVYSFVSQGKDYLFPSPANFRTAVPCAMFLPQLQGSPCISASVQPLAVFICLKPHWHRAWPFEYWES